MSHYKPYPAYRDSGIEWIGKVPEHWDVKPIKTVASYNDDSLPESLPPDTPIRYIDISAVSHDEGIAEAESLLFGEAPSRARRKAKVGDVIVSTVRTYLKAVASVNEANSDCVYSTGFAVLRPRYEQLKPEFLKWLALNELFIQAVEAHSEGLSYPAINASELVNLKTPVPSLTEQTYIARHLDRETARIDALIAKKTEFIKLLTKKRQALITHAVTKGLDPKAKMRDSGVEWIGEVPEHWQVVRIKRAAQIATDRCNVIPSGSPYIGLEDVESSSGQYKPTATTSRQSEDSTVGMFETGDVLYGKLRPYLRKCIIGPTDGACSTEFLVLKPSSVLPAWLQNWLLTADVTQQIEAGCDGAKMPRADWEHVGSIHIPAPAKSEQDAILGALDRETAHIDALIAKTKQSIDLLKKRRSALITAAVTGQIDLRGAA